MYIAIDLGGSNLRVAGSESLSNPQLQTIFKQPVSHFFEGDFSLLLLAINRTLHGHQANGIGFATAGDVDKRRGIIYSAENNPEWENMQIVERLMQNYSCRVVLVNDAEAAALAEARYGNGVGKDFIYISWGTGIGGAFSKEDKVQQLKWEDYLENWEQDCGGKNLTKKYGTDLAKLDAASWTEINQRFGKYVVGISQQLGIGEVILGGGVALKQKQGLQQLELPGVNLQFAKFGDESGLYGALAMLKA
jgi:hypothetical protein